MRNLTLSDEAQLCACCNCRSAASCAILEAAHVRRGHGSYTRVGLVVLRLANCDPFLGFWCAVHDDLGEAI